MKIESAQTYLKSMQWTGESSKVTQAIHVGEENQHDFFNFERTSIEFQSQNSVFFQSDEGNILNNLSSLIDYDMIGYQGKPIESLSQDEASALVSEDGFFGVTQTATRLADFVINGAGDDMDRLKAGREGIIRGFKEAESLWGGELYDISYKTLETALSSIDERINDLGGTVLDIDA